MAIMLWLAAGDVRYGVMTIGDFVLINAFMKEKNCADNPWGEGATTLEWTLTSPPPFHQFEELPQIK